MHFWALSGFLDTNPGKIFSQANPGKQEVALYLGNETPGIMLAWQPALPVLLATAVNGADIVELGWWRLGSEAVLLAHTRDGQRLPQDLDGTATRFSDTKLLAAVARVSGKAKVESIEILTDYDS